MQHYSGMNEDAFVLFMQSLPEEFDTKKLAQLDWSQRAATSDLSFIEPFLRESGLFDWVAYLERYTDLKNADIDPIKHFLSDGIFEGRKLIARRDESCQVAKIHLGRIKISVIIYSYNCRAFLAKCLESIINQTLKEIEIVIVDDNSQDGSFELIDNFCVYDSRIKVIRNDRHCGIHASRVVAVNIINGEYSLLIDPTYHFKLDALNILYNSARPDIDILQYISQDILADKVIALESCSPVMDCRIIRDYVFTDYTYSYNLSDKMLASHALKRAFMEMPDVAIREDVDILEYFFIVAYSMKYKRFDYQASFHVNTTSFPDDYQYNNEFLYQQSQREFVENLCGTLSKKYAVSIVAHLFSQEVKKLKCCAIEEKVSCFNRLVNKYGLVFTLTNSLYHFWKYNYPLAQLLEQFEQSNRDNVKSIGIFYFRLGPGGVETTLNALAKALISQGYLVTLFIEEKGKNDFDLIEGVNLVYLNKNTYKQSNEEHIDAFYTSMREWQIDLLFYMYAHEPILIWDSLILKKLNIPVVVFFATNFIYDLMINNILFPHETMLKTLKSAALVWCLSTTTELYLRSRGVDAHYLPTPVRNFSGRQKGLVRRNDIILIARMDAPGKRVYQALRILRQVLYSRKDVRLVLVGDFNQSKLKEKFFAAVSALELHGYVEITGWTNHPEFYMDRGKILLSTSYYEGLPNNISEGLSRGLPVVMYELDIMQTRENESIISVPKGDIKAAAEAILALLDDEREYDRLSRNAVFQSDRFNSSHFMDGIISLLKSIGKTCRLTRYTSNDYNLAISEISNYAIRGIPT